MVGEGIGWVGWGLVTRDWHTPPNVGTVIATRVHAQARRHAGAYILSSGWYDSPALWENGQPIKIYFARKA